ncbi:MAG: hypothetical protein ACI9BD_000422 [Candidatus Marinamargulisbacteria bacterium]|jgi:hypothetical protein
MMDTGRYLSEIKSGVARITTPLLALSDRIFFLAKSRKQLLKLLPTAGKFTGSYRQKTIWLARNTPLKLRAGMLMLGTI